MGPGAAGRKPLHKVAAACCSLPPSGAMRSRPPRWLIED
ncbi:hypothetical protein [Azospirillum largimobile]